MRSNQIPSQGRLIRVHIEFREQLVRDVVPCYRHECITPRVLRQHEENVVQHTAYLVGGLRFAGYVEGKNCAHREHCDHCVGAEYHHV